MVPLLFGEMTMLAGAREMVKSGTFSPKACRIKIRNNAPIRTFFLGFAVSLVSTFLYIAPVKNLVTIDLTDNRVIV